MTKRTRREFLRDAALAGAAFGSSAHPALAGRPDSLVSDRSPAAPTVALTWLGAQPPALPAGVSCGVPWAKGAVRRESTFRLEAQGVSLPLQSWPLAYWPDGSLKWSGFATVVPAGHTGQLRLQPGASTAPGHVTVSHDGPSIVVSTGVLRAVLSTPGSADLLQSMSIDGRVVAGPAQLVCILQSGPTDEAEEVRPREKFLSHIKSVTVEQTGPVRAVVRFEGVHKGVSSGREWLPFVVRLYFYTGESAVRMVHTILFDGDQEKDFIHGLGITFAVPMREEIQNRHVRLSGEDGGLWAEPIQPLTGRGGPTRVVPDAGGKDAYPTQLEGRRVPNRAEMSARSRGLVDQWAVWDDFRLLQLDPHGFTLHKRTNPGSTWLFAAAGRRSTGFVFVGDVSGGLGVGVKNFWQSYPAELHVQHASAAVAQLTAWVWSPQAAPMDLRHYDTRAHGLEAAYEDVQPGNSTPYGIGRTSELMLYPTADVPASATLAVMAHAATALPLLTASPQYYHDVRAIGLWSVRDTSTPFKAAMESNLDAMLALYLEQVDQRNWYGFWNFGDVMHSFDKPRHAWRYDLGGMAWDNSELGTDTWLWYSFLRSGREDIFRMAEAMTRHTGEVDSYHFGPMAGLGTRHGVSHWGDGAKEARIGQAAFRRPYYYLTTDERTGDIMRGALQAEHSVAAYDPMRVADPPLPGDPPFAVRVRSGPDWLALAGNWMTEWERTGNTAYRDKILTGMRSIVAMPHGFRTGRNMVMGLDAATGKLTARDSSQGAYNLATIMGGAELMFELNLSIDDADWKRTWAAYCADSGTSISEGKLQAYAYSVTRGPSLSRSAIASLSKQTRPLVTALASPPDVLAAMNDGTDTNGASQNSLNTIGVLEFCSDALPTVAPAEASH